MFKKIFGKSTKRKEGEEEDDPVAVAEAQPGEGDKDKAAAPKTTAKTTPSGDGGAKMYRRLELEAEKRAQARAAGAVDAVQGPTFVMKLPGTSQAQEAVATQSSAVRATRLMKELERINKCESVKAGVFSVSLMDDNLFEWDMKYYKFDPESALANDIANMNLDYGIDNVWFRLSFPENFPFAPPFVRVLAPLVQGGYVLSGGAICLELLTPQGWVQSCKMEAVILQIAAAITQGGARIVPSVQLDFNESEARKAYDYLVKTHAKYGWKDLAKEDG